MLARICILSRLPQPAGARQQEKGCGAAAVSTALGWRTPSARRPEDVHDHAVVGKVALKLFAGDVGLLVTDHVAAVHEHLEHRAADAEHARDLARARDLAGGRGHGGGRRQDAEARPLEAPRGTLIRTDAATSRTRAVSRGTPSACPLRPLRPTALSRAAAAPLPVRPAWPLRPLRRFKMQLAGRPGRVGDPVAAPRQAVTRR